MELLLAWAPAAPAAALPPLQRLCESESTATPGELDLWADLDAIIVNLPIKIGN